MACGGEGGSRLLPKILAVDHLDGRIHCSEVVEQTRIDADAAGALVPASVRLEGRAVGERAAAAHRAEVMGHELRVPAIDRIVGG